MLTKMMVWNLGAVDSDTVLFGRELSTFRSVLLHPSSGRRTVIKACFLQMFLPI